MALILLLRLFLSAPADNANKLHALLRLIIELKLEARESGAWVFPVGVPLMTSRVLTWKLTTSRAY